MEKNFYQVGKIKMQTLKTFIRFLSTGWVSYIVNIGVTYILVDTLFISAKIAYIFSLALVTVINFNLSLFFVFRKNFSFSTLSKYLIFLLSFSLLNYFLVFLIQGFFSSLNLYIIIFFINTLIVILKFFTYKIFVFR